MASKHVELIKAIRRAADIASTREPIIARRCDRKWRARLKNLPANSLKKKLRFLIGNCRIKTIKALYDAGILNVDEDILTFAVKCAKKRRPNGLIDRVFEGIVGLFLSRRDMPIEHTSTKRMFLRL